MQIQGNFDLGAKFLGTVVYRYLSGKPFSRQVTAGAFSSRFPLDQGGQDGDRRSGFVRYDVPGSERARRSAIGRSFGAREAFRVDLQLFNVFNNDAHDSFQTLLVECWGLLLSESPCLAATFGRAYRAQMVIPGVASEVLS